MSDCEDSCRQILDQVSDGICEIDFHRWTFIYVNEALCRMLGLPRAEFLTLEPAGILDPASLRQLEARSVQWLGGQEPEPLVQGRMAARDGRILDVQLNVRYTRDEAGQPFGATIIVRDVTGQLQAEAELQSIHEALKAANDETQVVLDSIDEGFCIIEVLFSDAGEPVDYRFLRTNRAFVRQTGIEQAIGRRMTEIAPLHEPYWYRIYGDVALTGKPVRFEAPASAIGFYYDVYAFRYGNPDLCQVGVLFQDISARKQIERELAESHLEMERRTQELNAVIQSIPDGLAIFNRTGALTFVNEEARRFYESYEVPLQSDMAEPLQAAKVSTLDGKPLSWPERPLYQALKKGETVRSFAMVSGKGENRLYSAVSSAPILGADGQVNGAVALLRDITQQVLHEQWLRASEGRALALVTRLQESDRNKSRFLSILSHELRNPLAAIVMSLSLLDAAPDAERARHAKDVLKRQTAQLTRLVDDLLDITRISENKIKLKKETVDIGQLVQRTLADLHATRDWNGRIIELTLPGRPLHVMADPARLTQAIDNLLYNALKFTREHDRIQVSVLADPGLQEAQIRIADTGIGIDPDILPSLFEPFTQADTSLDHSQGGLGLGLSIVKGIVELHGGRATADSEGPGKGAQFTIHLPLLPVDETRRSPAGKAVAAGRARELAVVIIEDNQDLAELLGHLVRMMGHQALIANTGQQGFDLAVQNDPDVIICDIGLPDINGYEVAAMVRGHAGLAGVRLFAMSGYGQPEDLERSLAAGFDRHLTKPVTVDAIQEALNEVHPAPRS